MGHFGLSAASKIEEEQPCLSRSKISDWNADFGKEKKQKNAESIPNYFFYVTVPVAEPSLENPGILSAFEASNQPSNIVSLVVGGVEFVYFFPFLGDG